MSSVLPTTHVWLRATWQDEDTEPLRKPPREPEPPPPSDEAPEEPPQRPQAARSIGERTA
jgi:hypothetical protein